MSISIQLLWVLSGLGAAAFAASNRSNLRLWIGMAAGFIAAASQFSPQRLPDVIWVGGAAALVAAGQIFRPRWVRWVSDDLAAIFAGCLGGILAALLRLDGMPIPAAWCMAAALLAITVWLSIRNSNFAPAVLQEEASLLMLLLGLASAVVPSVLEGWQSAGALNARAASGLKLPDASLLMPTWVLAVTGISLAFGGMWAIWRHR